MTQRAVILSCDYRYSKAARGKSDKEEEREMFEILNTVRVPLSVWSTEPNIPLRSDEINS